MDDEVTVDVEMYSGTVVQYRGCGDDELKG